MEKLCLEVTVGVTDHPLTLQTLEFVMEGYYIRTYISFLGLL